VPDVEVARLAAHFPEPPYHDYARDSVAYRAALADSRPFSRWAQRNVRSHKRKGYAIVTLSLKRTGTPPGDATAGEMEAIAELAERYSYGEIRVTHEQNLVLADVPQNDLHALWGRLEALGFATPNIGLLTDIVCCPGGDFCSLANAKSIPIAEAIRAIRRLDYLGTPVSWSSTCPGAWAPPRHRFGHIASSASTEPIWHRNAGGGRNDAPPAR
jgi:sulfite reductase (NADPH) hemoprotein beta-component